MEDNLIKSKYFKYLIDNAESIDKDRIEFNDKIISLLDSKTDELGTVLKCHLIIEHYIDEYLANSYPTIKSWDKARLTFNHKLELINNPHTVVGMLYPGIKCINSLRNKFSHKLAFKIEKRDFKEISEIMTIWNNALGKPIPQGLRLIGEFTIWTCGNLNSMTQGIKKHSPNTGLSGYLEWLKEMNS